MILVSIDNKLCSQCGQPAVSELWARQQVRELGPELPAISEGSWHKVGTYCQIHINEYEPLEAARYQDTEIRPITLPVE
jgi:hypothetical protein